MSRTNSSMTGAYSALNTASHISKSRPGSTPNAQAIPVHTRRLSSMFGPRYIVCGRENDGDFLLVITGSKKKAPFLEDWPKFKDNLRRTVYEQPGWADVTDSAKSNNYKHGWSRIKNEQDAIRAYDNYSRDSALLVHVWQTSLSTSTFRLWKCNCSSHFPDVKPGAHAEDQAGLDMERVNGLLSGSAGQTSSSAQDQNAQSQPAYHYQYPDSQPLPPHGEQFPLGPYQTPYHYPMTQSSGQYQVPEESLMPQGTVYYSHSTGIPVNVSHGALLTESRRIFISGLNYTDNDADLLSLLNSVCRPLEYNRIISSTGTFRGSASVLFQTPQEAHDAISKFNGMTYGRRTLTARLDKDKTVVGSTTPLIVSSTMYTPPSNTSN